ncbi:glycosyltransferase [Latilactobacillus curvatus]|uniref:glycosyltransferase family 2 protein n=1 Tax=Latilactobacillus curvatus TaxID=28038 RepID=UPI0020C7DDB6|nr:glycosyltransferase [Latilactobacillus curvatus]MCP8850482.1 glycosyltransferase [Latilactobacillus curvatus]
MNNETGPLFSVIVPIYEVAEYLNQCVDSIMKNSVGSKYEVLLIDDGSKDASGSICDDYAELYENIRTFHTPNGGLSAARNFGLKHATGKYILFIDSDDWIRSDTLQYFEKIYFENTDVDIIAFDFAVPDRNGKDLGKKYGFSERKLGNKFISGTKAVEELFKGNIRSYACMSLYKRDLFVKNNIEFPTGRNYEDVATTYKLLYASKMVYLLSQKLYFYVQRKGSISHVDKITDVQDIIQNNIEINDFFKGNDNSKTFNTLLKVFQIQRIFTGYRIAVNIKSIEAEKFANQIKQEILKDANSVDVLKMLPKKQLIKVGLLKINILRHLLKRS